MRPGKISGIYVIRNIVDGKRYVGSGVDVYNRWSNHIATLNAGSHSNKYLLRAWRKHGAAAFDFLLVERVRDHAKLAEREQAWMDEYEVCDRKKGYNLQPVARSPLGSKRTKAQKKRIEEYTKRVANSPEGRKQRSEQAKRQWANPKMRPILVAAAAKGRASKKPMTEEARRKHAEMLRSHIKAQTSEEMSRRSRLRKSIRPRLDRELI